MSQFKMSANVPPGFAKVGYSVFLSLAWRSFGLLTAKLQKLIRITNVDGLVLQPNLHNSVCYLAFFVQPILLKKYNVLSTSFLKPNLLKNQKPK